MKERNDVVLQFQLCVFRVVPVIPKVQLTCGQPRQKPSPIQIKIHNDGALGIKIPIDAKMIGHQIPPIRQCFEIPLYIREGALIEIQAATTKK